MEGKKIAKWSGIGLVALILVYVGYVIYFEARLGYLQPRGSTSLVIATFDNGDRHERVLRLEQIGGNNYIAANHWPRAWYSQALDNPNVEVQLPGEDSFEPYVAVPLDGEELQRISEIYSFGFEFRFRTGFPPRRFLRLDLR